MRRQRFRGLAPAGTRPKTDEAAFSIKNLHLIEGAEIEHQPPHIGRQPAKPVATTAHRHREVLLTRKTQSLHNIFIVLGAYNHCWTSCLIEDIAQLIIGLISR